MMSSRLKQLALAITLVVFVGSSFVVAQPPGGGGDRRGGDRRGGDRRGGPPGGGRFGGGGDRGGGDRGGGDRGGGDRGGGDRGGRGFDPSAMLRRLDRNGDGTLSPDETEGRARGFIERFVPGADLSKPITIEKLGRQVQDARADRERNSRRGNDEDEGPEPLVPGFEIEFELPPVLGFGVSDSYFDVKTNDDDRDEARQLLRRYDRNRDGKLSREEVNRARWRDDPWQYDQNKDSVITEYELMVRFALRRQSREGDRDRNDRRRDNDDERRREKDRKQPQEDDRGSYRFATAHERLPKATPDWFIEKDFNKDGQVMMFEYASKWDEETAGEFDKWDLNRDGVIVPREAINAPSDDNDDAIASRPNGDKGGNSKDEPRKIDNSKAERYRKYAASVIKKYDENGDGQLSEKEYSKMRRPPKDADRDGNKRITLDELTEHTLKM